MSMQGLPYSFYAHAWSKDNLDDMTAYDYHSRVGKQDVSRDSCLFLFQ